MDSMQVQCAWCYASLDTTSKVFLCELIPNSFYCCYHCAMKAGIDYLKKQKLEAQASEHRAHEVFTNTLASLDKPSIEDALAMHSLGIEASSVYTPQTKTELEIDFAKLASYLETL